MKNNKFVSFIRQVKNIILAKVPKSAIQSEDKQIELSIEDFPPNLYLKNLSDTLWFNLLLKPDYLKIPIFPTEEIQTRFTGIANLATMKQAFHFYKVIWEACQKNSTMVSSMDAILDFGCGWGRIIRIFMRDLDPKKLYGIDCIQEMVDLCRETNSWCNFSTNDPQPPTNFGANTFNLVYAYSVFSHLSESTGTSWIKEFHRILKPGGLVVITSRKRDFLENLKNPPYPENLNVSQGYIDFDSGKYVYFGTGGGFNLTADFYGEAFISKKFIEKDWDRLFTLANFIEEAPYIDQNVIVLVKKSV